ncbi:MAG TPA: ATP-binding protein [Candidatus Krumholzibacteria bacterium]|nr:ATP-binding protein [Candidatus Krumholzibacteria bacterium]
MKPRDAAGRTESAPHRDANRPPRRRSPSLQARFVLYLVILHVVFAGVAALLLRGHRPWLLAVEVFFLISALVALRLVRKLLEPARLLRSGVQLLEDGDFATHFRATGHAELDVLAQVFNRMSHMLHEQRILNEEKESFLGRMLTATPSGVITFDFEDRIALANPGAARMLDCAPEELVGRTLPDLDSAFARGLAELAVGATTILVLRGRRRIKCQKGEFFDRGFTRRFVLLEELTEELRRSEKAAYDKLIRMMSHEVNNTTGAVNSLLHSCRTYAEQLAPPDRREFETALDVAMRRSSHMNQFMRGFADVVRIPSPARTPQDLHQLLDDILRLVEPEATSRQIRIEAKRAPTFPEVSCDASQMEQVLVNVLRNAMEAIGSHGTITLRTNHASSHGGVGPSLVVEDSGPGFTADTARQLFTPFFTTKENGQGIGLTVVREILETHGFEYSFESTAGEPTRFSIFFGGSSQPLVH